MRSNKWINYWNRRIYYSLNKNDRHIIDIIWTFKELQNRHCQHWMKAKTWNRYAFKFRFLIFLIFVKFFLAPTDHRYHSFLAFVCVCECVKCVASLSLSLSFLLAHSTHTQSTYYPAANRLEFGGLNTKI